MIVNQEYELHSQLCTRDGRIVGNGIIRRIYEDGGQELFEVETDFGNVSVYTHAELFTRYHVPDKTHDLARWREDRQSLIEMPVAILEREPYNMVVRQHFRGIDQLYLPPRMLPVVRACLANGRATLLSIHAACVDADDSISWESDYDYDSEEYRHGTVSVELDGEIVAEEDVSI